MGFFHLLNCFVLATGPHFLVYRSSGMRENDSFWRIFKAAIFYGLTQMFKFFLATLIPHDGEEYSQGDYVSFGFLGAAVDLLVIFLIVRRLSARNELHVMTASMGWSLAALLTTKYLPLWVGTRGPEFEWQHLSLSYQANLELLLTFSIFSTLWLLLRREGSVSCTVVASFVVVCVALRQIAFEYMEYHWTSILQQLCAKTLLTVALGSATLILRASMQTGKVKSNTESSRSVWKDVLETIHRIFQQSVPQTTGPGRSREGKTNGSNSAKRR